MTDDSENDFDVDAFRITTPGRPGRAAGVKPEAPMARSERRTRTARVRPFVRGPIPLDWVTRASGLPGKALATGIALWFQAGCRRCHRVPLTRTTLERFQVKRKAGYAALAVLEEAGLIRADRKAGRSPWVTIIVGVPREGVPEVTQA